MDVDVGKKSLNMNIGTSDDLSMNMEQTTNVELDVSSPQIVPMSMENVKIIGMGIETAIVRNIEGDVYEGEYTITPSQSSQVLQTSRKVCNRNITVNPIPNNYGLITWNGSFLTVS